MIKRFAAAAVLAGLAMAGLGAYALRQRYAGFAGEVMVNVPKGMSTRAVAEALENAGVVRTRWHLLGARLLRPRAVVQAGEYKFEKPASALEVLDRLSRGDIFYYEVVIPEGSNMYEIAETVSQLGWISAAEFLREASNASTIRDIAPQAATLEGYLFPATYRLTRSTTAKRLSKDMTDHFREVWKGLGTTADPHATVTLASLVEKETGVASERPLVASVFVNRLARNMRLECDPTTVYAALLEGRYRGTVYRSDLDNTHPYNTYQHEGLPPGPIANPGKAALEAALKPAETDYLYFVAKPGQAGEHVFSGDLASHEKAVAAYRRGQDKGKPASAAPGNAKGAKKRSGRRG